MVKRAMTDEILYDFLQDIKGNVGTLGEDVSQIGSSVKLIQAELEHKVDDITFLNDMTVFRQKVNEEVDDKIRCSRKVRKIDWMRTLKNAAYLFTITSGLSLGLAKLFL